MTAKGLRVDKETFESVDSRLFDRELYETIPNALPLSELEITLRHQGIKDTLVRQMLERTFGERLSLDRMAAKGLLGSIAFESSIPRSHKYVALCGPAGSGKTTTLIKLAAQLKVAFDLEVGFVTCDVSESLNTCAVRRFSRLLEAPYRRVRQLRAVQENTREFDQCDLVLIDTPSSTTAKELRAVEWIEKLMMVPATSSYDELATYLCDYDSVGEQRMVLSKVDLTGTVGGAVSAIAEHGRPLSLITTGKRVPDDIEPATARRLGWLLTRTMH